MDANSDTPAEVEDPQPSALLSHLTAAAREVPDPLLYLLLVYLLLRSSPPALDKLALLISELTKLIQLLGQV